MALPRRLLTLCPAAVFAVALAGCSVDNGKISTHDQMGFDMWMSDLSQHVPSDEIRVVKEAEKEIKLNIMATTNLHGESAIQGAFFDRVNGLTASQFIALGLDDRMKRIASDRDEAKKLFDDNSKIRTQPGDTGSQQYLDTRVNEDKGRLDRDDADLASTKADQEKYAPVTTASP